MREGLKKFFRSAADEAAESLYPSRITCARCGSDVFAGETFCAECFKVLTANRGKFCPNCGMPTSGEGGYCIRCENSVHYYERIYSAYVYDEGIKPLLRKFKEMGEKWLGAEFARELWDYMKSYGIEADVLTFVPTTAKKVRIRGYNQAEVLARELSKFSGIPCEPMLEKTSDTGDQKELTAVARAENLKGKFRLLHGRIAETRRVLLIDDVATTGATLGECCRVLSMVCENGVKCLTFCTAVRKIRTE